MTRYLWTAAITAVLLILAGCAAPKFRPSTNAGDTAMAQAYWQCQQQWRAELNQANVTAAFNSSAQGAVIGLSLGKNRYITNCMKAHGYEVAE